MTTYYLALKGLNNLHNLPIVEIWKWLESGGRDGEFIEAKRISKKLTCISYYIIT